MGVQNIPEGFAVAAPLLAVGVSPARAALVAFPESQARGNERIASITLLLGFALMMTLDNALG